LTQEQVVKTLWQKIYFFFVASLVASLVAVAIAIAAAALLTVS
jgi:hypothetical protein